MEKYMMCVVFKRNEKIVSTKIFYYFKDEGEYYMPYDLIKFEDRYDDYILYSWSSFEMPLNCDCGNDCDNGFLYNNVIDDKQIGIKSIRLV